MDAAWLVGRFLTQFVHEYVSTVAMFDDVFRSKFGIEFPLAAPFWVVQSACVRWLHLTSVVDSNMWTVADFESDLSSIDPPTAEGYLDLAYVTLPHARVLCWVCRRM